MATKKAFLLSIEDYPSGVDLPLARDSAVGFARGMGFDLATECEEKKEGNVKEDLFVPKSKGVPALADITPILYYAGHGSDGGPQFVDGQAASSVEMELGANTVLAVFDCCEILKNCKQWRLPFKGLRYMLGFSASPIPHADRGAKLAHLLKSNYTISEAWKGAVVGTGAQSWVSLRAYIGADPGESTWPLAGPLSTKEPLNFDCTAWKSKLPATDCLRRGEVGSEICLFATPELGGGEADEIELVKWFKMNVEDRLIGFKSKSRILLDKRASLEVFDTSSSFWWNRLPYKSDKAGLNALPFDYLASLTGLAFGKGFHGYKIFEPWESFTTRSTFTQGGSENRTLQIARNIEFSLYLDDLPVVGPGACFRVALTLWGLSEVVFFYRKSIRYINVPIISQVDAELQLRFHSDFEEVSDAIQVLSWTLGYYSLEPYEVQEYLVPVYIFEGVVAAPPFEDYRFVRYVQAITEDARVKFPPSSILRRLPRVFP